MARKWLGCFKAITMKQERARLAVVIKSLMAAKTRNNLLVRRDNTEMEETITLKMIVTRQQA